MSTGDLNGNVARLLRELKAIKYPSDVDEVGLRLGDPVAFLPLLSFALLKFSRHVARLIVRNGFELAGKTDQRFIESSFKLFRDVLNVRTVLTPAQFFEQGYAERKVLLLCDVITVCKKLHNEEVRQERLAALKASRQEHVGSKLTAPAGRKSPVVKVVRHDDVEVHQVLAPQHLPNASDGAQSVYKATKTVAKARSPSPSPSGPPAAGKAALRPRSPLGFQSAGRSGDSLELTFRPATGGQAGGGAAQRQVPSSRGAAPRTGQPIRTWFMNPAFDGIEEEGAEGGADLGLGASFGFGGAGRPDSSAWWQSAPFPGAQQTAAPWQQYSLAAAAAGSGSSPAQAAAGRPGGGGLSSGTAAAQQRSGGQAGASSPAAAPSLPASRQPAVNPFLAPMYAPAASGRAGGVTSAVTAAVAGANSTATTGMFPARALDEWSFSKYFGPGKVAQQSRGRAVSEEEETESGQQLAASAAGGGRAASGARLDTAGELAAGDEGAVLGSRWTRHGQPISSDLERDGPAPDQDRRIVPQGISTEPDAHVGSRADALTSGPSRGPGQHQRGGTHEHGSGDREGPAAAPAADRSTVVEAELRARLEQLEGETQQQLRQLRERLAAAEEELEKCRSEAKQSREALQARVTVLEGRVRFLECELEVCVKRQPGTDLAGHQSPPHRAPSPTVTSEPSVAAWQSPGRPRSAAAALQAAASEPAAGAHMRASSAAPHLTDTHTAPPSAGAPAIASFNRLGPSHVEAPGHSQAPASAGLSRDWHAALGVTAAPNPPSVGQAASGEGVVSHTGSTGHRHSFSPMPQPSFLFQPRSLMQQVASASAGGAPPAQAQSALRASGPAAGAAHIDSLSTLDASSRSGAIGSTATDGQAQAGSALQTTALGMPGGGAFGGGTLPAYGPASQSWRAPERAGPRGLGTGSILDGIGGASAAHFQGTAPPYGRSASAGLPQSQDEGTRLSQLALANPTDAAETAVRSAAGTSSAAAAPAAADYGSGSYVTPGVQAGGGSVLPAPGTGGSASGFRNTDDLINSLYSRYAEAQDFLQTLRRR